MLSLIVTILFGLGITFFAFQNSILVPVNPLGTQIFNIPLYLVAIISLLAGIIMAWIISMMDGLSHFMQIRGKENVIHNDKKEIKQLKEQIHDLEIKQEKLLVEKNSNGVDNKPSFTKRIQTQFS